VADPTQIKDMDAIVARYLANELTDDEAAAFEAYVQTHPEVTREIELVARMKSGLATLRDRGDLRNLVQQPARAGFKPWMLAAASLAAVAVAALLFLGRGTGGHGALLASVTPDMTVSSRVMLARTRSDVLEILASPSPGTVAELVVEPSAPAPADGYRVSLFRLEASAKELGTLEGVGSRPDGKLHLFVRAEDLAAGHYLVRLQGTSPEPEEFLLRVGQVR
jgi:anti-sigma factor RsiW